MERSAIAVVGLNFGSYVINQIVDGPGGRFFRLAGVCDLDREKCARKAHDLGVRAYAGLDEILADPTIDAVGLFTGPAGRAELIRRIVRAGKHTMTTKPFERDADAAVRVLHEAERAGKAVFLNSPSPGLPPDLAQVEAWRTEHALGRPVGARFDVWASYFEQADGRWYDDFAQCPVAPIFRIGIYLINDAVRLFGEADAVQTLSSRLRTDRPTPDNAQLGIRFRCGALVNIFASFCIDDGDAHRNAMTLNFERGTIYRNAGPAQTSAREGGSEMALVMRGASGREMRAQAVLPRYNPQHVYQWEAFDRAIRKGVSSVDRVAPETVGRAIRIIEAMAEAEAQDGVAPVRPLGTTAGAAP
jgi:predicted dehydrogenase